jgi:glucokinase
MQAILALDIGGTKMALSLWEGETLVKKLKFATPPTPDAAIARIVDSIDQLHLLQKPAAIGVSCGGPLDSKRGLILSPPNLPGWDEIPLVSILQDKTDIPCFLENDANACALAEWYWGAGRGYKDLAFLTFGTGLGCGLILDGRLYRGACDLAGEVGHIRITEDGPEGYGKRGSWEGYCSGGGLSRAYAALTGREETGKYICDAAEAGEVDACAVIETCAFYLGRGLSLLIDMLNPQCIILGSIFARSEALFRPVMDEVIARETLRASREHCRIVPAQLGEMLGDRAALGIAINNLQCIEAVP